MTYYYGTEYSYAISHHGVKGQKWGVRRYQNKDGTRTALGKRHEQQLAGVVYDRLSARNQYKSAVRNAKQAKRSRFNKNAKDYGDVETSVEKNYKPGQKLSEKDKKRISDADAKFKSADKASKEQYKADIKAAKEQYKQAKKEGRQLTTGQKVAIGAAISAGIAVAGYATYKISKNKYDKYSDIAENLFRKDSERLIDSAGRLYERNRATGQSIKSGTYKGSNRPVSGVRNVHATTTEKSGMRQKAENWADAASKTLYGRTFGRDRTYNAVSSTSVYYNHPAGQYRRTTDWDEYIPGRGYRRQTTRLTRKR